MEEGFNLGVEGGVEVRERMWNLERLSVDEIEKIINLLAERPNSWEIVDGQFLFESDQQVDQFNEYSANIDKIIAEQAELQESAVQRQRQRIEELF